MYTEVVTVNDTLLSVAPYIKSRHGSTVRGRCVLFFCQTHRVSTYLPSPYKPQRRPLTGFDPPSFRPCLAVPLTLIDDYLSRGREL